MQSHEGYEELSLYILSKIRLKRDLITRFEYVHREKKILATKKLFYLVTKMLNKNQSLKIEVRGI